MSVGDKVTDDLVRRDAVVQCFPDTFSSDRASYEVGESSAKADKQVEDRDLKWVL